MIVADLFGIGDMLSHEFMRNAFVAGTAIAMASGLVGYFLVLRSQVFTGDALSHVAFTGALGALAVGIDLRIGLFASVVAVSLLLGALGQRGRADDVVIGSVFVWILGLGVLFLSLFTTSRATGNSTAGVSVLFGSIFGLSNGRTATAAFIAVAVTFAIVLVLPALSVHVPLTSVPLVSAVRLVPVVQLSIPLCTVPASPLLVKLTATSVLFQPLALAAGALTAVGALGEVLSMLMLLTVEESAALPALSTQLPVLVAD